MTTAVPAWAAASDATKVSLAVTNNELPASGAKSVVVTVRDHADVPLTGRAVSLLGPSGSAIDPPSGTTNGSGVFSATVDLKTPWMTPGSMVTLTAVSGTASASQPVVVLGANAYDTFPPAQFERVFPSPVVSITSTHYQGANNAVVLADGSVWTRGSQGAMMGDGSTSGRSTWGKVPGIEGAAEVVAGTGGGGALGFFLVRLKNGEVWGWGSNGSGQLGNAASQGTTTSVPVKADGVGDARAVAAAGNASFVLRSGGVLWVMGSNAYATAGISSNDQGNYPLTRVAVDVSVVSVAARRLGGYCVGSDGSLWGWGYGYGSYVGGGDAENVNRPTPLKLLVDNNGAALPTNFVSVWAGLARAANTNYAAVFAVTADGAVYGWGENGNGQLGQGDSSPRSNINRPTLVPGATNVSRIYVSSRSVSALRTDGTMLVWGETELAGIGTTSTPTALTGLRPIVGLSQNSYNPYGQERNFITGSEALTVDVEGATLTAGVASNVTATVTSGGTAESGVAVALSATAGSVLAAMSGATSPAGKVQTTVTPDTWTTPGATVTVTGSTDFGQATDSLKVLGANVYDSFPPAQFERVFPSPVVSITSTHYQGANNAVVLADGSVWTRGSQGAMMGDGSTSGRSVWGRVPGIEGAAEVVAGTNGGGGPGFFLVRLKNGEVWGWGANGSGQLGNAASQGTVTNVPVKMDGVGNAVGVAAAFNSAFVLRSGDTLWAVGSNNVGTAGLGSDQGIHPLTQVAVGVGVVSVSTRAAGGYCVGSDGSLWGWGYGFGSYVGGGNGDTHLSPLKLLVDNSGAPLPTNFVSVWAGLARAANFSYAAVFAVTADGAVYGWGENGNGQLGQGDSSPRSNIYRPTLVPGATNVRSIYVSSRSVSALRKDGTMLVWGETELAGIGTTSIPTAVAGLRPITGLTKNAFNPFGQERYFITTP